MTLLELAPLAAVCAAGGVALLLTRPETRVRIGGSALVAIGSAPLVLLRFPNLGERVGDSPVLAVGLSATGVIALVALAGIFSRLPWLGVVLALLASLRIPLNPSDPSPTDHLALLWIVVAAGLLAHLWLVIRAGRPATIRLGRVGAALAAYVLLAAISLFWSEGREQGAYTFVAFYIPLGTLAALIGTMSLRPPPARSLATTQVAFGAAVALVAVYQVATGALPWNDELIFGNSQLGYIRANGLFWDASELGRYLALAIVTVLGVVALDATRRRSILGASAISALLFAGLVISYSRAGLVTLVLGIALVAVAWRPRVALPVAIAGLAIAAVAVVVAAIGSSVDLNELSSNREVIAQEGIAAFRSAPILGVGLGGYPDSHSVVLGVAAELGVLGVLALLTLMVAVGLAALRPADPSRARLFRTIATIQLAMIFVHSMVDAGLFDDGFAWALAAIVAVLAAPASQAQRSGAPSAFDPAGAPRALDPAGSVTTSTSCGNVTARPSSGRVARSR